SRLPAMCPEPAKTLGVGLMKQGISGFLAVTDWIRREVLATSMTCGSSIPRPGPGLGSLEVTLRMYLELMGLRAQVPRATYLAHDRYPLPGPIMTATSGFLEDTEPEPQTLATLMTCGNSAPLPLPGHGWGEAAPSMSTEIGEQKAF